LTGFPSRPLGGVKLLGGQTWVGENPGQAIPRPENENLPKIPAGQKTTLKKRGTYEHFCRRERRKSPCRVLNRGPGQDHLSENWTCKKARKIVSKPAKTPLTPDSPSENRTRRGVARTEQDFQASSSTNSRSPVEPTEFLFQFARLPLPPFQEAAGGQL